jgi:hypothetical protein
MDFINIKFKDIASTQNFTDPDYKIEKHVVNAMIGCLKPKDTTKWKSHFIVQDKNEAYYQYLKYDSAFIDVKQIEDENYYHVFEKYKITKPETEMPIWNQIVEMANIQLDI